MSIPLATTTISVRRLPADDPDDPRDTYDAEPGRDTIASRIRAHLSNPFGREQLAGGSQEIIDIRLDCDPTDLTHLDRVVDDTTGDVYTVVWAVHRRGLGLDHVEAGLRVVKGAV